MLRAALFAVLLATAACAPAIQTPTRAAATPSALPAMKTFGAHRTVPPARSNAAIAADFLDLTFALESGRALPAMTRFEGPISVRLAGPAPATLGADLERLLHRLRREAGIEIARTNAADANVTVEVVPQAALRRAVPQAACFVVPRLGSWDEFRRNRRSPALDWATLARRERLAVFLPAGTPPQEMRDCLHEELAQALGPLNDLYRLNDSVFNDDNIHTVLTGFDMLILRMTYAPELASGMTRAEVAARLPGLLARLNPGGRAGAGPAPPTTRDWIGAIERALGPTGTDRTRRRAAKRAVAIARERGWGGNRLGFSLFALGRLSVAAEPQLALASFLQAEAIYAADPATRLHAAHVAMQLAAFALSAGDAEAALAIAARHRPAAEAAENAALLALFLMVEAEARALLGQDKTAGAFRREAEGWARYGFGEDATVRARLDEIAGLAPGAET